jgi:predicted TIM-barrel fold metal-dependent hydrolase
LFSTDYPFERSSHNGARSFLAEAGLTETDRDLIASGNWDRLCAGIRR